MTLQNFESEGNARVSSSVAVVSQCPAGGPAFVPQRNTGVSRHRANFGETVRDCIAPAGLAPSSLSTLLVEGDNRPGLGHAVAKAIGDAGINMSFVMAQVVGRRYSALIGFEALGRRGVT